LLSSELHIGDPIEVNIRGVHFKATITGKPPGLLAIMPEEPQRYTWRFVSARQVVKKLEPQERLGVAS
jgi:hypothetical protein